MVSNQRESRSYVVWPLFLLVLVSCLFVLLLEQLDSAGPTTKKEETATAELVNSGCWRETDSEVFHHRRMQPLWTCPDVKDSFYLGDYRAGDIKLSP